MSDLEMVSGGECLNYINRMVGFGSHAISGGTIHDILANASVHVQREGTSSTIYNPGYYVTNILRWRHDTSKRKIGLVLGKSEDGGYEVALLGNEEIGNGQYTSGNVGWCDFTSIRFACGLRQDYTYQLIGGDYKRDDTYSVYPTCSVYGSIGSSGVPAYWVEINESMNNYLNFDESNNYNPIWTYYLSVQPFHDNWRYNGQITQAQVYNLTTNKNTTMVFGHRALNVTTFPQFYKDNPLRVLGGNLYQWACDEAFALEPFYPPKIHGEIFDFYDLPYKLDEVDLNNNKGCNLTSVPYNIILTYDENQAKRYLQDGTLPSDAFLFPLDFDNLPTYQSDDSSDEDDDDGQGDLDDDSRDCDSDLPEVPTYTPNSLNTNNVYLLTVGEVNQIINWIWNDVGSVQDLDDLVTKIQGLTSDLIQNFLMFRVMPVKPAWIGGAGNSTNFVVGSVEKAGEYLNLAKGNAPIVNIGSYNFGNKFNTFKFLNYSPYSDFKLYLPYHGFVDIDVSVFQGHSLDVKAVYDYMTGTITYMIYSDNTWLVNTYTAKMAVDLSVSLQTKNDRDSAIFGNVSNAVAGVMSAGASVASGNPIGLIMGAQALVQQTHSAPFKAMGQVGEMGAFYTPQRCKVLIRRPVPTTPETYNQNVGRQAYYSTTLAKLKGKGYTKCINPRLKFTKTIPLADEEEKINQLLSEGVYL